MKMQMLERPLCPVCNDQGIVWVEDKNDAVMHRCGFCESGKEHPLAEFSLLESLDEISLVKKSSESKLTLL